MKLFKQTEHQDETLSGLGRLVYQSWFLFCLLEVVASCFLVLVVFSCVCFVVEELKGNERGLWMPLSPLVYRGKEG